MPSVRAERDRLLGGALRPHDRLVIGVHVRTFDGNHDWPNVAPQPAVDPASAKATRPPRSKFAVGAAADDGASGAAQAMTFDQVAPRALFAEAIAAALRAHPRAAVFVAGNADAAKRALVEGVAADALAAGRPLAADRLVALDNGGSDGRADANGVRRALTEWLLLGEASLVVHSFGSSYGEEAAALHLRPSVRVRAGGNIYGPDLSFPECNHLQFKNHATARAVEAGTGAVGKDGVFCYKDEARLADVCTPALRVVPCDRAIGAWGMDAWC